MSSGDKVGSSSMRRPYSPHQVRPSTGRLCSSGSGAFRSPSSSLLFGPPTPCSPWATAPVPLVCSLPGCACFFLAGSRGHSLPRVRWGFFPGSPDPGIGPGKRRVSQFARPSSCFVPRSKTPLRASRPDPSRSRRCCLRRSVPLGHADCAFRGCVTRGPLLVCLRIVGSVTLPDARLTTSLPGSALAGWVSHPPDGTPNFKASLFPFPLVEYLLVASLNSICCAAPKITVRLGHRRNRDSRACQGTCQGSRRALLGESSLPHSLRSVCDRVAGRAEGLPASVVLAAPAEAVGRERRSGPPRRERAHDCRSGA